MTERMPYESIVRTPGDEMPSIVCTLSPAALQDLLAKAGVSAPEHLPEDVLRSTYCPEGLGRVMLELRLFDEGETPSPPVLSTVL